MNPVPPVTKIMLAIIADLRFRYGIQLVTVLKTFIFLKRIMEHQATKNYHLPNRLGFHYFPDCLHYAEKDVQRWLPALKEINAQWLVVQSPVNRAIPEDFIRSFSASGINLVIDFNAPLSDPIDWHDLELLVAFYGKWGAKYAMLNQHPNQKRAWASSQWGDFHLIESVISDFIRFGSICLENGIRPVFPLLTPGGNYWDLAFIKNALTKLKEDAPLAVQNNFVLSAAAWDWGKSLDWGAGGQNRWPKVKPYKLPQESQNQLGFRTYEWYAPIAREVFGKSIPILLLQAGIANTPQDPDLKVQSAGIEKLLAIHHLLKGENVYEALDETRLLQPISSDVIGCCFYLLSSESPAHQACKWFSANGLRLPLAQAVYISEQGDQEKKAEIEPEESQSKVNFNHNRYILIAPELHPDTPILLGLLHPYIEKFKPMIGYSAAEAKKSAMILAIAPNFDSEPPEFDQIKNNGSLVKIIRPGEIPAYLKELDHANK
jgi:hypothetical protein